MAERDNPASSINQYLSAIGSKGGRARSDSKRQASRSNLARAREAQELYRRHPELRPPSPSQPEENEQ